MVVEEIKTPSIAFKDPAPVLVVTCFHEENAVLAESGVQKSEHGYGVTQMFDHVPHCNRVEAVVGKRVQQADTVVRLGAFDCRFALFDADSIPTAINRRANEGARTRAKIQQAARFQTNGFDLA